MDALWVFEGNVKSVQTHEPRVEELVKLEREQGATYHNRPRVALVDLSKLLIASILPEHENKEDSKQDIAEDLHNDSKSSSIEYERNNVIGNLSECFSYTHQTSS